MYERRTIATARLSFAELKQRALINFAAHAASDVLDFLRSIRDDRLDF
jgi:hypothetical protein